MGILIGMDEAGYGPNLGPLVVAATAWEVEEEDSGFGVHDSGGADGLRSPRLCRGAGQAPRTGLARRAAVVASAVREPGREPGKMPGLYDVDLYRLLRPIVARTPHEKRVPIADSKVLYRPGSGLRQLERGLHAVLGAMERPAACWSEVVALCGADPLGHHHKLCWHDGFDCELPIDAAPDELARLGLRFAKACDKARVRPLAICARLVFPAEFNELVANHDTKGTALSHVTVGLLREVMDSVRVGGEQGTGTNRSNVRNLPVAEAIGASPLFAVCDKHGGRNFYAGVLQHHFSEHWIEPLFEGAEESRYEWGPAEARVGVAFRTSGESFLATALASMTAKYLRELAMRAFNEFWCARVSGLRPTAGYPIDARRFKDAIEAKQRELRIDDHIVWRSR